MTRSLFVLLIAALPLPAADWPQWMGPKRDAVWPEDGVLEAFPKGGPRVLWRTPVGGGYSGPAVVGDRVYVTDYVTDGDVLKENFDRKKLAGKERVLCLDAKTGKGVWKHEYDKAYTISYPAGPRCTPTVDGDRVYALGAEGDL
jgi:outer membrane protein assembly factor BamB